MSESTLLLQKYENYLDGVLQLMNLQDDVKAQEQHIDTLLAKEKEIRDKVPGIIWFCIILLGGIGTFLFPIFLTIIGAIMGLLIGCLLAAIFHAYDKFKKSADEYHAANVVPAEWEYQRKKEKIEEYLQTPLMEQFFNEIPEEYRTISALKFFIKMLKNRQADTEKELYNLYMEYTQRQELINLQNQQIELSNELLTKQAELNSTAKQQLTSLNEISNRQNKISKQVRYGNAVETLDFLTKKK